MTLNQIDQVRRWIKRARPRIRTQLLPSKYDAGGYGLILLTEGQKFKTHDADDAIKWCQAQPR